MPGETYLLFDTMGALSRKLPTTLRTAADAVVPSTVGELLSIASTYRASPLQREAALALGTWGRQVIVISDLRYELDDEGRVIEGRAFPHRS